MTVVAPLASVVVTLPVPVAPVVVLPLRPRSATSVFFPAPTVAPTPSESAALPADAGGLGPVTVVSLLVLRDCTVRPGIEVVVVGAVVWPVDVPVLDDPVTLIVVSRPLGRVEITVLTTPCKRGSPFDPRC